MAGHNKWSQIKRQKGTADNKRAKLFGKLVQMITTEAKLAAGNREAVGLQRAITRARAENMPKENIERAIERGLKK